MRSKHFEYQLTNKYFMLKIDLNREFAWESFCCTFYHKFWTSYLHSNILHHYKFIKNNPTRLSKQKRMGKIKTPWISHHLQYISCLMTKPTKWPERPAKTQISLGIRPVWSASSLCTQWVAKDPSFLHADIEDSDQTGRMPRLIWVFSGRTCLFVGFVVRQLYYVALQISLFNDQVQDLIKLVRPSLILLAKVRPTLKIFSFPLNTRPYQKEQGRSVKYFFFISERGTKNSKIWKRYQNQLNFFKMLQNTLNLEFYHKISLKDNKLVQKTVLTGKYKFW